MIAWKCSNCGNLLDHLSQKCQNCSTAFYRSNGVWLSPNTSFSPEGFSKERRDHLWSIENDHFWFKSRNELISRLLGRLKKPSDRSFIDLGCGTAKTLGSLNLKELEVVALDAYSDSLERGVQRGISATFLCSNVENVPIADSQFDLLTAFDVHEHVDPDRFLSEARRLAKPKARLLVSVPASQSLWSDLDEKAGHRCRYSPQLLKEELSKTGWKPISYTHYQFLLYPLVWLSRKLNPPSEHRMERTPPRSIASVLHTVNQFEVMMFSRKKLPIGSSLMMWAEVD